MSDDGTDGHNVIPLQRRGGSKRVRAGRGASWIEQELLDSWNDGIRTLEDDPIDAADRAAIDNEGVFIQRFGFDAPRQRRRHVLDLKYHADLTDREIRQLHRTGSLSFSATAATISASIFIFAWAWFLLLYTLALMFSTFLAGIHVATPTGHRSLCSSRSSAFCSLFLESCSTPTCSRAASSSG